jgi:hypothetical protein
MFGDPPRLAFASCIEDQDGLHILRVSQILVLHYTIRARGS